MRRSEDGGVVIFAVVLVVLAGMVMMGIAHAGSAAGNSARADTAADSAALAAAASLARTEGAAMAAVRAQEAAADNGAQFRTCDCTGDHAEVTVDVDGATGRARAEVRRACLFMARTCDSDGP